MKKLIFLLACVINFQLQAIEPLEPTTLFLGTIKFPEELNNNDLCLYYKGTKLATEWDKNNLSSQFSFVESKLSQTLYVLVCNDISCKADKDNTIQHLHVIGDTYLCYELQATRIYDEQDNFTSFSWDSKEIKLEDGIIPDNTVIFLFNPNLVEGLLVHTWNKNQAMRLVPTIRILNTATSKEIIRAMTIARLKAVDIDTIHAKECVKKNRIAPSKN